MCGNSLQLMKELPEAAVDCVITDPPYSGFGLTQENFADVMRPFVAGILRCVGSGQRVAISQPKPRLVDLARMMAANRAIEIPDAFEDERDESAFFVYKNPIHEEVPDGENWSGFAATTHPNPRDVNKMAVLVKMMSNPGDTILDPFCGSGAIGLASVMLGRNFIGMELMEARAEDAAKRLELLGSSRGRSF